MKRAGLFAIAASIVSTHVGAQTYTEITPPASAVTASTSDTNVAAGAVDNDPATRWSGSGDGAWIQLDLGTPRSVGRISVAVHQGNLRRNRFDLQYATTSGTWNPILTGRESSGTTLAEEAYDFAAVTARWVRYVGHGATLNAGGTSPWNSVAEISVWSPSAPSADVNLTPGGAAVSASTNDGNVPANAVDGSLATRWSANGDGHWLTLDLGARKTVSLVKVASYQGNTRANVFEVQLSDDNAAWRTVWTGQSSGTSTALQDFDLEDQPAQWVRYLGHGNTVNTWNSVAEIQVWGTACASCSTPTPTPTPTTGTTPTPTPTPSPTATPTPTPTPTVPSSSACFDRFDTGAPASQWVFYNAARALSYRTLDSRGDRIMDFSHAGYMGGGVALPTSATRVTLSPTSSGDDTARIQTAINQVAALAPDARGIRGAVMLNAGTYRVNGTLNLTVGGVVLRGAGSGTGGTRINLTGSANKAIGIAGSGSWTLGSAANITAAYLPSGGRTFTVSSTAGLGVGARVLVQRLVTSAWVQFMGMHDLVRNGEPQTWIAAGSLIRTDRTIAAIAGNQVTLDVPLSDSFDAARVSGTLTPYTFSGRIAQVGVEGLRVVAPAGDPDSPPGFKLLSIDAATDSWVRDVFGQDLRNGVSVADTSKRITLDRVTLDHTYPSNTAAAPGDFGISGTQTLLTRCKSTNSAGAFYALTQATDVGPIVLLDFQASGGTAVQPHQRWATGMLVDRARLTSGAIEYMNRGNLGSGHGWTMGWGVSWNSEAARFTLQRPPGTTNWAIGNKGTIVDRAEYGSSDTTLLPRGAFDSHGTFVQPDSLYLAQLCERLGPQALANIGY